LATKTTPKEKKNSNKTAEQILSVSEYASAYGLTENFVRGKLKKGELQATELIKNGRSVQGIKITGESEKKAPSKVNEKASSSTTVVDEKKPKLLKLETLKPVNYQAIIQQKENELLRYKEELKHAVQCLNRQDAEIQRLNEQARNLTEQLQVLEDKLKTINEVQVEETLPEAKVIAEEKAEKKKPGFFASLFGKK